MTLPNLRFTGKSGFTVDASACRSLTLSNCRDVTVRGLTVEFSPDAKTVSSTGAVRVLDCAGVVLEALTVRGGPSLVGVAQDADPAEKRPGDNIVGLPTGRGVSLERCSDVTVKDSLISGFHKGIVLSTCSGIAIIGNDVGEVRTGCISGRAEHVRIAGNRLHDSRPWKLGGKGDHADFIHLWTDGYEEPVQGVVIEDNILDQGDGAPIMGIYLDDNGHGIGFESLSVQRNAVLSDHQQCLRVELGRSGKIDGNAFLNRVTTPRPILTAGTVLKAERSLMMAKAPQEAWEAMRWGRQVR